jgi:hypothetical protein
VFLSKTTCLTGQIRCAAGAQHSLPQGKELWAASVRWRKPNVAAVAKMWEAFSWFRFAMPTESKLVLMVVSGVSWRTLARYGEQSINEVQADFDAAVERIAAGVAAAELAA